jgi:hypothetical protein
VKAVRNSLVLIAAGMVLAGTAPAKEPVASFRHDDPTNYFASATLDLNKEPKVVLDSDTQITGLLVNCAKPQIFWAMLNTSVPTADQANRLPSPVPVVKAPHTFNDNLAVHEPDFALIRISFH